MSKWVLKISWSKDRSRHRRLWETSPNRKGSVLQHTTTPAASWSAGLSTLPITASTTGGDPGCAVTPSELARKKKQFKNYQRQILFNKLQKDIKQSLDKREETKEQSNYAHF